MSLRTSAFLSGMGELNGGLQPLGEDLLDVGEGDGVERGRGGRAVRAMIQAAWG